MKPIKSILFLSVVVIAIIAFWLTPGINKAKDTSYVRYYEDTSLKQLDTKAPSDSLRKKRQRKIYKSERINSKDKFSRLNAKQFSRSMQFQDSLEVHLETLPSIELVQVDSTTSDF